MVSEHLYPAVAFTSLLPESQRAIMAMLSTLATLLMLQATVGLSRDGGHHVTHMSFYDWDPSDQHSFCTEGTAVAHGDNISTLLSAFAQYKLPSIMDVEDLGGGFDHGMYVRGGLNNTHLSPKWKALVDGLLTPSTIEHIGPGKAITGIFLGDVREPAAAARTHSNRHTHTHTLHMLPPGSRPPNPLLLHPGQVERPAFLCKPSPHPSSTGAVLRRAAGQRARGARHVYQTQTRGQRGLHICAPRLGALSSRSNQRICTGLHGGQQ